MLSQSAISGFSEAALRYWITASDDGLLRELDSGMTEAEAQVDDSKAAALVKPRMLVATTRLQVASRENCTLVLLTTLQAVPAGNNSAAPPCQELKPCLAFLAGLINRVGTPELKLQPRNRMVPLQMKYL